MVKSEKRGNWAKHVFLPIFKLSPSCQAIFQMMSSCSFPKHLQTSCRKPIESTGSKHFVIPSERTVGRVQLKHFMDFCLGLDFSENVSIGDQGIMKLVYYMIGRDS